jgi:outer membrane lipoprotein carrier protein
MKQIKKLSLSILLLLICTTSNAKNGQESLESHLQKHKQLSGQFTQVISSDTSSHTQSSTGEFWVKKPNKFRWNYSTPYVQKIISNGNKIWIYDEDLEQVSIKDSNASIDASPLSIILGGSSVHQYFSIMEFTNKEDKEDLQWLRLDPKTDSTGFEYISVGFKSGTLTRMNLKDNFGQTTQLLFTNLAIHTPIGDDTFEFQPPEGSDIFDESTTPH